MIKYTGLLVYLAKHNLNLSYLRMAGLSSKTIAKIRKNEPLTIKTIEKICKLLEVQPGDIMFYSSDE